MVVRTDQEMLHCKKWRLYMARRPFSKPICAKEERNGLPKGFLQKQPCCLHPMGAPTHLPLSALSAGAEPKSQGDCQK